MIFGNGIILAIFHSFGSLPSRSEQLKIAVKAGASSAAWSFKTQAGMLSGPEALFGLLLRSRAFNVVCILIIHSSGSSPSTANTSLSTFKRGKCSLTDAKNHSCYWLAFRNFHQPPCLLTLAFFNYRSPLCPLVFFMFFHQSWDPVSLKAVTCFW